ncbi:unnamed protein product [Ilex paraguariensis]|uniref:Uncharacterized protein n=1 Tax=Ilex paraguariensis TaxID=185542 RepID=A0ABC8V0V7_9AQUA
MGKLFDTIVMQLLTTANKKTINVKLQAGIGLFREIIATTRVNEVQSNEEDQILKPQPQDVTVMLRLFSKEKHLILIRTGMRNNLGDRGVGEERTSEGIRWIKKKARENHSVQEASHCVPMTKDPATTH